MLAGRLVIVTGGAAGIGRATVLACARHGARAVLVADVHTPAPYSLATTDPAAACAMHYLHADVTNQQDIDAVLAFAATLGGVDLMVCNAGTALPDDGADIAVERYRLLMSVNLDGVFFFARAAAQQMRALGKRGSMVLMSSMGGLRGSERTTVYSATKGAIVLLAKSLADAFGPDGIRVNAICPGVIDTGLTNASPAVAAAQPTLIARTPLRRIGKPAEVAEAIAWLGSDLASFVSGETLVVDGGLSAVV